MNDPKLTVCALSRDVFFGMRIRTVIANLGHELVLTTSEPKLVSAGQTANLVLVDINQGVDWGLLAPMLASDTPVIAFGAHTDVAGFRAAKAAGVTRVVSNGEFSRNLPGLLLQYAK